MTLATIVTNVANEAGYSVDTPIIGSQETTAKQLLAMVNRINRDTFEAFPWPRCYASGAITLVAGQASYALPAAFSQIQYESFWNQSTRWRVLGPMSEREYADAQGYGLNTSVYQRFQIRGLTNNELTIWPTPEAQYAGNTIVFEYIADRAVKPRNWVTGTVFAAGAYCFNNGKYYVTTAGGTSGANAPTHSAGSASDGGITWTYYDGPYQEFLADTDVSVFNEKMIEQGVLERFAKVHGLDTIEPLYIQQMTEEFGRTYAGKNLYAGSVQEAAIFARNGVAVFGTWI